MKMYRGDLRPDLRILVTEQRRPLDLTSMQRITVIGHRPGEDEPLFEHIASGTTQGVVTMAWEESDTAEAGRISIEVELIWPDGKAQTIRPPTGVVVLNDYGGEEPGSA